MEVITEYYDVDLFSSIEMYKITEFDEIYVDGILYQNGVDPLRGCILYLIKNNISYILHRENGPACVDKSGLVAFFMYNGKNYKIEDMPVDDEIKCILKLKYGTHDENEKYYATYRL